MTKGEINLLYVEVEKLLHDICKFLKEEISSGYISPDGRSLANILIERSKHQLQTISKVAVVDTSDCNNEPYVDMQGCKANQEDAEPQEVYSDVSMIFEPSSNSPVLEEECYVCPYASLPANEIKEGKRGQIYRKEKILFFEQQKKVYAAVKNSWLLVYLNENSLKPCQTFDLNRYEAKPCSVPLKDMKRRDETFEIMSIIDTKIHYFTALTNKDMMQWVAAISKHPQKVIPKRSLPPVPSNDLPEKISLGSMECNDYEPLTAYQINQDTNASITRKSEITKEEEPMENTPLPLPPRNTPQKSKLIHVIPPRPPSEESLDNYDFVSGVAEQQPSSQENGSSFSDDDSDTFYDNPSDIRTKTVSYSTNSKVDNSIHLKDEDEDDIYDSLEKPNDITNLKPVDITNNKASHNEKESEIKAKTKPALKPKLLSLKYKRKTNL